MTYPECDQYECLECPRQHDCVDVDEAVLEGFTTEENIAADALLDYFEQRFNDLERRVRECEELKAGVERMFAAMNRAYETEEER